MSRTQRFFRAVLPRSWFAAIEAESKRWILHCKCGASHSIWDIGGLRYKGTRKKAIYTRCPECRQWSWQTVEILPAP